MLKKDITFIYQGAAEKAMYIPLCEEAKKRGYRVKMTTDKFCRCEIGFYCQHINFPQYSKFSVIMLHDIIQQYGNWPDIWYREPWNKYDIGILPSNQWEQNWKNSSQWYYARPRVGMFKIGWPKADMVSEIQKNSYREKFYTEYGLDPDKKTILYAPAWENDNKQDDFVNAMLPLGVNMVIKQADWNEERFPRIVKNIEEMYELHKSVKGLVILPRTMNIFHAIAVSDILVSEESSTMCEAAMMGKPAISVSNWLIPDTVPSRFPQCDYDFVTMTTKEELTGCAKNIIDHYDDFSRLVEDFAQKNFSNIGNVSVMIMDILDDCIRGGEIRYQMLQPAPNVRMPLKKRLRFRAACFKREIYYNYCERSSFLAGMWRAAKKGKDILGRIGI